MKKIFLAATAVLFSSIAFAQVDSTSQSAPSTDYSKSSPADTATQTGTQTDTVNNTGAQDTLSGQGSGSSGAIQPKSDTTAAAFTDEDLKKYAQVLDSVDAMKKDLLAELTAKVKSNPKITVSRYMELAKAGEDQAKLGELKATPEEIAFVKEVTEYKNQKAAEISEKVKALANDYVGIEAYSKIKNQLSWDSALETKIAEIRAENKKPETASSKK